MNDRSTGGAAGSRAPGSADASGARPPDSVAGESGTRDAPLAMDPEEFRRVAHALVDDVADFLASLRDRPVTPGEPPSTVREVIDADSPLPEDGSDAGELLRSAAAQLFDHSLFNGHPRFLGYITASPAPIGMLADFLAAAVNPNTGGWLLSPLASEIEAQTVRWIAELTGYPRDCGGLLVSGGNMANLVGFWAARAAMADWDVRVHGVCAPAHGAGTSAAARRALRVYGSAETHTWIEKATDLAGLGTDAMRWVPTDDELRMDPGELRRRIDEDLAAGRRPMMVVGTAGSVSTGAVDPLPEIAELCREYGIWFHVDGAYGGFAAAVPDAAPGLDALGLADSVAVDPHKWLYSPLEAGCALVRDADALRGAFSYHPPYYHFEEPAVNYVDYGPQNSRGFRALKVWLALRQVGRSGYERMIGEDIRLAERLHARVAEHPELEPLTQSLSIATFRYVPEEVASAREGAARAPDGAARAPGAADATPRDDAAPLDDAMPLDDATPRDDATEEYLDTLNRALLDRIQKSGEAFVSNAVIRGRYALRACVVNFNTTAADVDALPEIVARIGREVHAELCA